MALLIYRALRSLRSLGLCGVLAAAFAAPVFAAESPNEQQVEAAYLFNFARYVAWPDSAFAGAGDPLRICVLGDDGFVDVARSSVEGRKIGDRAVVVEARADVAGSDACHILFISSEASDLEEQVIAELGTKGVFSVSDSDGFAKRGGVANFVRQGNKIRFEINRGAAESAGLKVSSRLLRLAKVVE